ncbi:MAG: clostripain-related cysteine peptidase [Vulcanimicrobiota bacterium]
MVIRPDQVQLTARPRQAAQPPPSGEPVDRFEKGWLAPLKRLFAPPAREWTVVVYSNGNSDLETQEHSKIDRLADPGSSKTTDFVAQISSGSRGGQAQRLHLARKGAFDPCTKRPDRVEELGKTNMGARQSFIDFLLWAHREYPAEHFMVIFGGHGEGPKGGLHDDLHGQGLSPQDLQAGLAALQVARGGQKAEVVVADSCLLGGAEIGYQLKDHAEFYLGSEEVISTAGLDYARLGKGMRARNLDARDAVDVVINSLNPVSSLTFSAQDLSQMESFAGALAQFRQAAAAADQGQRLSELASQSQHFMRTQEVGPQAEGHSFQRLRDVGHFAQLVAEDEGLGPELRQAAHQLGQAVRQTVVENRFYSVDYEHAQGMSLHLAGDHEEGPGAYYADLDLSRDSGWDGKV